MFRAVYPNSILLHALWLLAVSPAVAADPPTDDRGDFNRWIPSLALTIGFTTQEHQGTVDSCVLDAAGGICAGLFARRIPSDNQKHFTALQAGGLAELQTPRLLSYEWSPRLFIGGEISHISAAKRPLAREGNPSKITFDPGNTPFPGNAILGQGSLTSSDADTILYGASIGVSIPVRIGDWRVSIKPSARYLNQEFVFTGVLVNAERQGLLGDQPRTQTVHIHADDSLDVHAVGPGLEIEIEAARVGSIAASVFISGGAYKVLSDRKVSFSGEARDNLDIGSYRGFFTAEIDPWIYRANLGFRVKWLGFSSGWLGRGD